MGTVVDVIDEARYRIEIEDEEDTEIVEYSQIISVL